jgi:signal transduction histidine kinase
MRRFATVRVRVTIAAVVVVGLALVLGGAVLVHVLRDSLTHDVETAARLRSRDIAATVNGGELSRTLAAARGDDHFAQVVDSNGTVVASSANIQGDARISTLDPGPNGYAARTVTGLPAGDSTFRIVARRVRAGNDVYTVYVAGSLNSVTNSANSLTDLLFIGLPLLLLLVGATTWVVTGRALRPVEAIRTEVEAIGAQDLHRRVPVPATSDEIGRLAHTMNAMLTRLDDATQRQHRFVADASHELRSPLTGIRTQLEVDLLHPEQADWEDTERSVLDDTVRLQRLVDDLLVLARTDSRPTDVTHRETVDLDEIVLTESRRLAGHTTHTVDTSAVSGAQLSGNADLLTRAVRNLLDNADRYASSAVVVSLVETDHCVVLTIADDGPGIPSAEQERIFERFTRLDDARTRETGGTGLGLAITHDVVTAHGGTITLDNDPGARFTLTFPLDDDSFSTGSADSS